MKFLYPWAFILILPLAFVIWRDWAFRKKRTASIQFSRMKSEMKNFISLRAKLRWLPVVLKNLAIFLAIIALARPQSSETKVKKNVEGIDIVLALDISDSMLIEDMEPVNRLESAKEVIKNFISGRISDRIGLVVFSGESYTRVPPTLDYPILLNNLKEVTTSRNIKMGTAIGVALGNAVSRLQDSLAKSRVIILLTDGANNTGTIAPEEALVIAKGYNIRVYTIGVGKDGQAMLPVYKTNIYGQKVKTYQPMHSQVNTDLLENIAKDTGGKFYRAEKTNNLSSVFADINSLEKSKIDINRFTKYHELYPNILFVALIALSLSLLLSRTWLRRVP